MDETVTILGAPGHVLPRSMEARLADMGGNAGNLIFQHAVARLIADPQVHLGGAGVPWEDAVHLTTARARVFPAANHLRTGADWSNLADFLDRDGPPLVVLGLGVQAESAADATATAARLRADPEARRLAEVLGRRAAAITVRGTFSREVCSALGIRGTRPLGCPSILIHPDPHLGLGLAAELDRLTAMLGGQGSRVRAVMSAAAPFEIHGDETRVALEQRLFSWIVADLAGLYLQQSGGAVSLRAATGQWQGLTEGTRRSLRRILAPDLAEADLAGHLLRGGRAPHDARLWIADLAGRDLVIGTRVHGVLAAIAAGRPGVLIPHDARTAELARTHHLPLLEARDVLDAPDLGAALARVRFDPLAFDRARRTSAAGLIAMFGRLGLTPAPAVQRLATSARSECAA